MIINSYAAMNPKSQLEKFKYEAKELGDWDIEVQISHCGICHSDIHLIDNDWGLSAYPLVPGHEIIGTVKSRGRNVTTFDIGHRVGIGWQRSSCMVCQYCVRGNENLCPSQQATCVANHGGFADYIRCDSRFAFPIPESMESENAAPLLCGGITVYSPLRHYGVSPWMKVGVIGIGGLGHLAIQYARAFGCEVTAFSSTPEKEEEARLFGAHHFVSSRDTSRMENMSASLDFIISTVHVELEWLAFINILKPNGNLCMVGVPPTPMSIPVFALIGGRKSISGSPIGNRATITEMLEFSARHGIRAKTEALPLSDVNIAIQKVRDNLARYRMVLLNH